jgi:hypothetical protein
MREATGTATSVAPTYTFVEEVVMALEKHVKDALGGFRDGVFKDGWSDKWTEKELHLAEAHWKTPVKR